MAPKAAAKAAPAKAAPPKPDAKKASAKPAAKAPAPKAPVKDPKPRAAPGSHSGVYVKNWGQGSVADIKGIFSSAGTVVSAQVRRRHYALVFFDSPAAVKKAIDLFNDKEVLGNVLTVVPAKTSPKPDPHEGSSVVFLSPIFRTSTTRKQILELFAGLKVLRLRTYRKNYAYVYLDSPAAALKVVKEKNGMEFRGKKLRVALSTRSLQKDKVRATRSRLLTDAHNFKKDSRKK
ncbi:putative RNA recognition motif (a k a RRM RBD or RNP domain) [Trypanosoma vivax]|uniref:Putative RNA-binding protein (Putative nrbd1) n=1 Tax=Trypanosoma vivax (strain Y486) TaxID=1055687 RepID=G0U8S2_TRYVY|nr:putative RNA recognition motif (a k a RRM RBD or RNP domain) [Trypanosoma vivax]KAH8603523.1 putative RNA recognition motif (a k a RRM RBD or RNP domain) [Trypanosoma vivax]KAH8618212.1 putative RNA recognition motif (a k a RRM RBD or RNP domain) [Trypanosoma vivax]KAH8618218.1 putative RNA recognition motif (a k a RRM RBD or RNP domain) [Trypanosoma vivax]CCC54002.1 putative NRBD1 [Trypanosoma vivax Y486]